MTKQEQEVLIKHVYELWKAVVDVTAEPHISFVVANLQRMEALRVKIQTQINKLEERESYAKQLTDTGDAFQYPQRKGDET